MFMPDTGNVALWHALNRLIMNYWADVDYNWGEKAHEFYFPDALYSVGNNRFEGIEKIRAFYERRRQIGNSATRHLITNLQVFAEEAAPQARVIGIMTLYRADGRPPFRGVKPPSMIADFEAECALADGARWRFRSHLLRPIFVSSDLPVSITIDPQRL